ncbi:MAG: T9SS type A sorting domain-containing protein [Saprospiraceae bacterium]|nr:T9SS type A sorting domain-containing protein [Saprospiraceae bacterium]
MDQLDKFNRRKWRFRWGIGADGSGGRGGDNSPGTVAQNGSGPGGGGGGRSDGNATVGTGAPGRVIITVLSFLPIQISSFDITSSKTPIITWTTLAESDNSHFILERSRNGEDFIQINTIQGKGTTDAKNEYAYTDLTPLKGTNYYRLKQVDYDGTITSFGIKSAYVTVDQIEVYPTLMQDLIRIEMPKTDRPMQWSISNSLGQRSLKGILAPGIENDAVNVQQLAPGTYFLSLQTQYGQEVFKLIKL